MNDTIGRSLIHSNMGAWHWLEHGGKIHITKDQENQICAITGCEIYLLQSLYGHIGRWHKNTAWDTGVSVKSLMQWVKNYSVPPRDDKRPVNGLQETLVKLLWENREQIKLLA